MRITVIGCGYLGATHAVCMAELGHEVLGVEIDELKRKTLETGEVPFHEPGLPDLLAKHVDSGQLRFTDSFEEAAEFGDIHFVCVGTPQNKRGLGADLSHVFGAIESLAPHLTRPALVVGKSTVPVGTAADLAAKLESLAPVGAGAELAWNPEVLREGYAVTDTLTPDRIVFGVSSAQAEQQLRDFYSDILALGTPLVVTDFATAELVKVSANAFLATKISFINAVAEVCDATGGDVVALADAIGHDNRIGRRFLNAGIGFGGGCLPKDIRAFVHRAGELGVEDAMGFLREVDGINQRLRTRTAQMVERRIGNLAGARIGILGVAFKPDSDDVRDSPALNIAGQLHLRGATVTIHDPAAIENSRKIFPTLTYVNDPLEACADADMVLHLTEWKQYREIDPVKLGEIVAVKRILDGRNALDPQVWKDAGWDYRGFGRR
jgi:UDPglucose 6-dehydrogenase